MSTEDKIRTVRTIVFEVWDPVGFGPVLPADEYDTYIPGIIHLLENHCSAEQLEALRQGAGWREGTHCGKGSCGQPTVE